MKTRLILCLLACTLAAGIIVAQTRSTGQPQALAATQPAQNAQAQGTNKDAKRQANADAHPNVRANAVPQAQQAATKPATQAAKYPSDELVAASAKTAEELKKKLDKDFNFIVEPPFVIAGDYSTDALRDYTEHCVVKPAAAMWKSYFKNKPDQVITVLLFHGDKSYRAWAKKLFNDKEDSPFGYYKPDKRTLVMNIETGGGTLIHELTHALVVYDFDDQPMWFNEGLASLHEGCRVGEDEVIGLTNWRLPGLQKAIKDKKLRSLADMVTKRDFYGDDRGMNYAQARYLCMYMQNKKVLKDFYAYFHDHHDKEGDDVKAIEHIFRKKIDEIEKDCNAWVLTLKFER